MDITTKKIFSGTEVAAGGSSESDAINLQGYANDGIFSLYIYETGDGTGQWTYELSADGSNFVEFSEATDIISSAFVNTSGPGGDGKDVIQFTPELAPFIKIKVTETGSSETLSPIAYLCIK